MAQQDQWVKVAPGIRARVHPTRKHGVRSDKYFVLRYRAGGQHRQEALGWASEGWTLAKAQAELVRLKEALRTGQGATSLAEKRQHAEVQRQADLAALQAETYRKVSFADYWRDHYWPHATRTKKRSSWIKEDQHFTKWLAPTLGRLAVVEIALPQWDALMKTLDKAGLSQRSKEYISGTARRVLRHAKERGLAVDIPTGKQLGATAPRDNRRLRVISNQEAQAILEALEARDRRAWRLTRFAFLTGCRLSEALNLRWGHVDLERSTLTFADTKNKDVRRLPLTPPLADLLAEIGRGADDAHVFVHQRGGPYSCVPQTFTKAVEELGLNQGRPARERLSFHSIRHSVATELAKVLSIRELMDTMGWKVVAMAARYTHTNPEAQHRALSGLENMLTSEPAKVVEFKRSSKNVSSRGVE